ncbi:MAG: hypothetical protein GX361_01295 [Bacteroidales bacterium]|nr:hypothetical protein [Bacteroidales bacterium]
MKTILEIKKIIFFLLFLFFIVGCKEDIQKIEVIRTLGFDISSSTENAPGKDYPLLSEVVPGSGIQNYRVVLRGANYPVGKTFQYRVVESETTALEGVHYRLLTEGNYKIPGRQKSGSVDIEILPFPDESDSHAIVVLELLEETGVQIDPERARIAIPIYLKEKEPEPLPIPDTPLWDVLNGGESVNGISYQTIYIDQFNPYLPEVLRQGLVDANNSIYADAQAGGTTPRQFYAIIIHFRANPALPSGTVDIAIAFSSDQSASTSATVMRNMSIDNGVVQYRYDFNPDSEGVGKFENSRGLRNTRYRTDYLLDVIYSYFEENEFKFDWVGGDIASPTRPNEYQGGLFGQGAIAGDLVFGSITTLPSSGRDPYAVFLKETGMQSSPKLHTCFFDNENIRYFNALTIDPDATYQSEGFKNTWSAAQAELASDNKSLHKMMMYFGVERFNFHVMHLATYYTDDKVQRKGLINFDFKIDYKGNVKPFLFYNYPLYDGEGEYGEASRTKALIDNLLMKKEFSILKNGSRVRFTDNSDSSFYFEGELGYYILNDFHALKWIP